MVSILSLGLSLSLMICGCGRDPAPKDPPPIEQAPETSTLKTNNPPESQNTPKPPSKEESVKKVEVAFAKAPEETQHRIQEAIKNIEEGNVKEGIGRLKMVDADTELTAEQQETIKDLIRAARQ